MHFNNLDGECYKIQTYDPRLVSLFQRITTNNYKVVNGLVQGF